MYSIIETSLSLTCFRPGRWILYIPLYFYFSLCASYLGSGSINVTLIMLNASLEATGVNCCNSLIFSPFSGFRQSFKFPVTNAVEILISMLYVWGYWWGTSSIEHMMAMGTRHGFRKQGYSGYRVKNLTKPSSPTFWPHPIQRGMWCQLSISNT